MLMGHSPLLLKTILHREKGTSLKPCDTENHVKSSYISVLLRVISYAISPIVTGFELQESTGPAFLVTLVYALNEVTDTLSRMPQVAGTPASSAPSQLLPKNRLQEVEEAWPRGIKKHHSSLENTRYWAKLKNLSSNTILLSPNLSQLQR